MVTHTTEISVRVVVSFHSFLDWEWASDGWSSDKALNEFDGSKVKELITTMAKRCQRSKAKGTLVT